MKTQAPTPPVELNVRDFDLPSAPKPRGPGDKNQNVTWLDFVPPSWLQPPLSSAALDLEIGCGVGLHPIQYATQHPERRLIAIEHTIKKFQSFNERVKHHSHLSNLVAIHSDAILWTAHLLPAASLSRVFILYPNPEPKAANKRWLRSPFMHELLKKLKPNGELTLATNDLAYFEEALLFGREFWKLDVRQERSFTQSTLPMMRPRTHFEKKYLLRGQTCFDVTFAKI